MTRSGRAIGRRHQQGWAGLIALLLALLIVGFLVRTLLKQMGVVERPETPAISPGSATPIANPSSDAGRTGDGTPSAGSALERARGVEGEVLQQAQDAAERLKALEK